MSSRSTTSRREPSRVKGIVAIAAGAVLLLGGGTTLAYWSTAESLTAGPVTSGDLDLALGDAEWTLDGVLTAEEEIDPSEVRIVPGDVLTLTQELDVTLIGDTIEALLTAETGTLVPVANAGDFVIELSLDGEGTEIDPTTYRLTPEDVDDPLTATLTITFKSATPNRDSVEVPLNLNAVTFTLTQASS